MRTKKLTTFVTTILRGLTSILHTTEQRQEEMFKASSDYRI